MEHRNDFDLLHQILPGKHFYQFYKGPADFLHVMLPFFQAGLDKGEACLWLVSRKIGLEFAQVSIANSIPGFSSFVSSGQFEILGAEDWYLMDEFFDEAKAIGGFERFFDEKRRLGFQRFRIAGDIGGAVPRTYWPSVEAYERKVSPWIKSESVIALCAYPILECTPSQAKEILGCHDDVLVGKL